VFKKLNDKMLYKFFPSHIAKIKSGRLKLAEENLFAKLLSIYWKYLYFWIFCIPMFILPSKIAYWVFNSADKLRRVKWYVQALMK
jgi:hypothetical protein